MKTERPQAGAPQAGAAPSRSPTVREGSSFQVEPRAGLGKADFPFQIPYFAFAIGDEVPKPSRSDRKQKKGPSMTVGLWLEFGFCDFRLSLYHCDEAGNNIKTRGLGRARRIDCSGVHTSDA
jgi:hypothetical protein